MFNVLDFFVFSPKFFTCLSNFVVFCFFFVKSLKKLSRSNLIFLRFEFGFLSSLQVHFSPVTKFPMAQKTHFVVRLCSFLEFYPDFEHSSFFHQKFEIQRSFMVMFFFCFKIER